MNHTVCKINLSHPTTLDFHRSGWNFAINALKPLHSDRGVYFDDFIENNFAWKHKKTGKRPDTVLEKMKKHGLYDLLATSEEKGITPYTQPWVGIIHNPPNMPTWFLYDSSPKTIFAKDIWKQSLDYCVGLFSLSEYYAQWLRTQTGKPVSTLIYPTEIPELQFDFDKFINNNQKKIVQVGWWLRKLHAIYQLPIGQNNSLKYEKIRLIPMYSPLAEQEINTLMQVEKEIEKLQIDQEYYNNTTEIIHIPNDEYDELLSENLVFMDLYDSSANTAVVECIARATPLLVNPLPAIVEYLGKDYPMYFNSLSEAAEKALDTSLIFDTHNYLKTCETRSKLRAEYFLNSFQQSEVYQLIEILK
ncbi:MAG: tetratricopeptide repeat protein [Nostoc sp. GBBB01]|nr:tetratricopeptide repeat protein [Nostoc sp. GBBB01]